MHLRIGRLGGWFLILLSTSGCILRTSIVDNPSGGNKDPGPRDRASAELVHFGSCTDLLTTLRTSLAEQMRVQLVQLRDNKQAMEGTPVPVDIDGSNGQGGQPVAGVDFSLTNTQESGVDEADVTKTDGAFIYTLNGPRLEILGIPRVGDLTPVSSTVIEGWPVEFLLHGNRAIVFSWVHVADATVEPALHDKLGTSIGDDFVYYAHVMTKVTVLDVSDRARPSLNRELYIEGDYQTARLHNAQLRLISYAWMDVPGLRYWPDLPSNFFSGTLDAGRRQQIWEQSIYATVARNNEIIATLPLDVFVPSLFEKTGSGVKETAFTDADCRDFVMSEDGTGRGVTSILTLDLGGTDVAFSASHIVSGRSIVYASPSTLVIAEPAQDWWWYWDNAQFAEATNLHRFSLGAAGGVDYTGSGRIPGTVRDSFSMSERDGVITALSTTGQWNRWWLQTPEAPSNHIFTLQGPSSLDILGKLEGLAQGEIITAARFVDSHAYLRSHRAEQPLWVVDLNDASNPYVVSELQVEGITASLHPIDPNHLIEIGMGSKAGLDGTTTISLYDTRIKASPKQLAKLSLALPSSDGWVINTSAAAYEHRAFQFWPRLSLLAIPVTTHRVVFIPDPASPNDSQAGQYQYQYLSQLRLVHVDLATGTLVERGAISHGDFYNGDPTQYWLNTDIRRSVFMTDGAHGTGDYVYAISNKGVTANRLDQTYTETARVSLRGHESIW